MSPTATTPWSLADIIDATGGVVHTGSRNILFEGFNTDSRHIRPEQCFVCLKGDTHDGHQYIQAAVRQGVRGVIIDQAFLGQMSLESLDAAGVTSVAVKDTLSALGDLAAFRRQRSGLSVMALTGSNGKTTTRSMITGVASRRFNVLSPFGNYNNLVGVPLTLLRIEPDHEWAILELGMNCPGEIRRLGQICSPDIGLITNIGPAHLEGLGSLEGIMEAKGELIEAIASTGIMIFNADDPMVMRLAKRTVCQTLLFGLTAEAEIRASSLENTARGIFFQMRVPEGERRIHLQIPGAFNVSNALAAAAAGVCLGIPLDDIQMALQSFTPVHGRLNVLEMRENIHLIDDTYNANPASVKAAIGTLEKLSGDRRSIAVLGDMLELGNAAAELHTDIGRYAGRSKLDKLFITGQFAAAVELGALEGGIPPADIFCGSKEEIVDRLDRAIESNDWILVKGSRGMRMETVVQALTVKHGKVENPS